MEIMDYIAERKEQILRLIEIDYKIRADPYDNFARLKEVEKIEKILKQEIFRKNEKGGRNVRNTESFNKRHSRKSLNISDRKNLAAA